MNMQDKEIDFTCHVHKIFSCYINQQKRQTNENQLLSSKHPQSLFTANYFYKDFKIHHLIHLLFTSESSNICLLSFMLEKFYAYKLVKPYKNFLLILIFVDEKKNLILGYCHIDVRPWWELQPAIFRFESHDLTYFTDT